MGSGAGFRNQWIAADGGCGSFRQHLTQKLAGRGDAVAVFSVQFARLARQRRPDLARVARQALTGLARLGPLRRLGLDRATRYVSLLLLLTLLDDVVEVVPRWCEPSCWYLALLLGGREPLR